MRIGVFLIAVVVTWLLLAVLRGRLHPVGGLGVALGATVLLFPVVQPWYLLWAIIPLACLGHPAGDSAAAAIASRWSSASSGRRANGDRFALFQIVLATVASTVIVLILIALTYYRLPWRKLPDPGGAGAAARGRRTALPAPQAAKPGAYAESP